MAIHCFQYLQLLKYNLNKYMSLHNLCITNKTSIRNEIIFTLMSFMYTFFSFSLASLMFYGSAIV